MEHENDIIGWSNMTFLLGGTMVWQQNDSMQYIQHESALYYDIWQTKLRHWDSCDSISKKKNVLRCLSSCCISCLPDLLCRIKHVVSELHFDKEIQWYPESLSASLTSLSVSLLRSRCIRLSP